MDGHGEYERILRTSAMIDIILNMNPLPDIVCLQEVVPVTRNLINERLNKHYDDQSHLERQHMRGLFFTMMLVSKEVKYLSGERSAFRCGTGMDRDLVHARIDLGGERVVSIYTSHLDSMPASSDRRCAQLQEIYRLLRSSMDCAVWCGDSNLSCREGRGEEDRYALGDEGLTHIDDAWKASGADKLHGHGSMANTWCRLYTDDTTTSQLYARFDRFYSNQSQHFRVSNVNDGGYVLVGCDPLRADLIPKTIAAGYSTPSDHYGVCVTYAISAREGGAAEGHVAKRAGSTSDLPDHFQSPTSPGMDDAITMNFSPQQQQAHSSSSSSSHQVPSLTPPENNYPNTFAHAFSPPQPRKSRRPVDDASTIFAIPMFGDNEAAATGEEDNDIFMGGNMYA